MFGTDFVDSRFGPPGSTSACVRDLFGARDLRAHCRINLIDVYDQPGRESRAGLPLGARRGYGRALFYTTAIAVSLLIVSAIVFTISAGTRRITVHAENLHTADEALRVATVARAQLGFANHLAAVQRELGTDVATALEQSSRQAADALGELKIGADRVVAAEAEGNPDLLVAVTTFTSLGQDVLDMIAAGRSLEADALVAGDLQDTYVTAFALLESARDEQIARIEASDVLLARLGDIARFLVAFLIPLAVIIIASHEFRTPLTSIYGLSQLVEEDPDSSEATREYAAIISSEAADLTRMVEDLLTVARLESGALTYLAEEVTTDEETTEVLRPFNRARTVVSVDVLPAVVRVDRLRQRQVLRNLVSNAHRYGGPNIEIVGRKDGDTYQWIVRDDGDGVPEELAAKLFQRFIHRGTTVVVPGGVGLGLSIVRALAEGMGGSVSYRRRSGWSEFIVDVPLATSPGSPVSSGDRNQLNAGVSKSRGAVPVSQRGRRG
jgi:signal transduction histidine kinase